MKNPRIILILKLILCLFFSICDLANAESKPCTTWKCLETKHAIIHYPSSEVLKIFDEKIHYPMKQGDIVNFVSLQASGGMEWNAEMKLNAIFERVQAMLDMRKPMRKINIRVFPNKENLFLSYSSTLKSPHRNYHPYNPLRAWYTYELNTIFLSVDDLHEGILAHELAHAIIDNYLLIRPPEATAEILARYVDQHLHDK